jgi:hypothetical protein
MESQRKGRASVEAWPDTTALTAIVCAVYVAMCIPWSPSRPGQRGLVATRVFTSRKYCERELDDVGKILRFITLVFLVKTNKLKPEYRTNSCTTSSPCRHNCPIIVDELDVNAGYRGVEATEVK